MIVYPKGKANRCNEVYLKGKVTRGNVVIRSKEGLYMEYALTLIVIAVGFLDWCLCACHKTDPAFLQEVEDALQEAWCKTLKR